MFGWLNGGKSRTPLRKPEPVVPERSAPDILAEAKAEARSRGRFTRYVSPSWLLEGRRGLVVLVVFLLAGGGFFLFRFATGGSNADPLYLEYEPGDPVEDAGRRLTGVEYGFASMFGDPRELGPQGLPVVEHKTTGEVRELTPVEERFYEETEGLEVPFLRTGTNEVAWAPGPSGWGMWWKDTSELDALKPLEAYPRFRWREKQDNELRLAVGMLIPLIDGLLETDLELWDDTVMRRASHGVAQIKEAFPLGGESGYWSEIPDQWRCSEELDAQLNLGITQGCPPREYLIALSETWHQFGLVVRHVEGMARVGRQMDEVAYEDLMDSGLYHTQYFYFITLSEKLDDLSFALRVLFRVSVDQELPIDVGLQGY